MTNKSRQIGELAQFFDTVPLDIHCDLSEWNEVKKELLRKKYF